MTSPRTPSPDDAAKRAGWETMLRSEAMTDDGAEIDFYCALGNAYAADTGLAALHEENQRLAVDLQWQKDVCQGLGIKAFDLTARVATLEAALASAVSMLRSGEPFHEVACTGCEQIKAALEAASPAVPTP